MNSFLCSFFIKMINKLLLSMNQTIKEKNYLFSEINYFLIIILPITLLAGSLISNATVLLISIIFIFDLIYRKRFFII